MSFYFLFFISLVCGSAIYDGLENTNVERKIDLSTSIVREVITMTVTNKGDQTSSEYVLLIPFPTSNHVSFVRAEEESGSELAVSRPVNDTVASGPVGETDDGVPTNGPGSVYRITLARPLEPKASQKLIVLCVYTHLQQPKPASVTQNEHQLVLYQASPYLYSPYRTARQSTALKLASSVVEDYSEHGGPATSQLKGSTLTYGPFKDQGPRSWALMRVHFENNTPFVGADRFTKLIEVSHWGNVAVEEQYVLRNTGARLRGSFSRYDYQRNPAGSASAVRSLKQQLPVGAKHVYYRDEIGNISTSHLAPARRGKPRDLELIPRYVLFGGWQALFIVGYNLPLARYLFTDSNDGSRFMLNMTFGSSFTTPLALDQATVHVMLPEGASDVQLHTPFPVDDQHMDRALTYLDVSGRPVLVAHKSNLVQDHNQYFQVTYTFQARSMLAEPLMLVAAFFALCLAIMGYTRLEFSLKPPHKRSERDIELDQALLAFVDLCERRDELHAALDGALAKHAKTKDKASFDSNRKQIEAQFGAYKKDAFKILYKLEPLSPEDAATVRQANQAELNRQLAHLELVGLELQRRSGALKDDQYQRNRLRLQARFDDLTETVNRSIAQWQT